jgi:hypothetical protein
MPGPPSSVSTHGKKDPRKQTIIQAPPPPCSETQSLINVLT